MNARTTTLSSLGLLVLVAAALALLWGGAAGEPGAGRPDALRITWAAGDQRAYRIDSNSHVDLNGEPVDLDIGGVMLLRVFAVDSDGADLGMQLDQAYYRLQGQMEEGRSAALSAPFTVHMDDDGEFTDFAFPDHTHSQMYTRKYTTGTAH